MSKLYHRVYWTLLISIVAIMPESVTYRLWHWIHIDLHWCKDGPKTFLRSLAQDICKTLEWVGWKNEPDML